MNRVRDLSALHMDLIVKRNVSLGEYRLDPNGTGSWRVSCTLYAGGNKEDAKSGIEEFLREAWGAYDVAFWQAKGEKSGKFFVYFESELLKI